MLGSRSTPAVLNSLSRGESGCWALDQHPQSSTPSVEEERDVGFELALEPALARRPQSSTASVEENRYVGFEPALARRPQLWV